MKLKVVVVFVIVTVVGSEGKGEVVHSIWSNRAGLRGYLRGTKRAAMEGKKRSGKRWQ